jgi:hypothetical protein
LDGSPIVDPYFRPQWLPNFSNIRAHCGIRSGLQKPGMKSCGVCALGCSVFRGSDRFTVTKSVQKWRGNCLSRRDLPVISALVAIRQTQVRLLRRRRHSSKQVLEPNIRVQTVERWVDSQVRYSKRTLIESAVKPEERLIFVASICIGNGH